jgi:hypothetical protein
MANPLPGETPFAIDGTGRVIRVGDAVEVRPISCSEIAGPAVVLDICREETSCAIVRCGRQEGMIPLHRIHRADDHERTPTGLPLWSYL